MRSCSGNSMRRSRPGESRDVVAALGRSQAVLPLRGEAMPRKPKRPAPKAAPEKAEKASVRLGIVVIEAEGPDAGRVAGAALHFALLAASSGRLPSGGNR